MASLQEVIIEWWETISKYEKIFVGKQSHYSWKYLTIIYFTIVSCFENVNHYSLKNFELVVQHNDKYNVLLYKIRERSPLELHVSASTKWLPLHVLTLWKNVWCCFWNQLIVKCTFMASGAKHAKYFATRFVTQKVVGIQTLLS